MNMRKRFLNIALSIVLLFFTTLASAGQADIIDAKVLPSGDAWRFTVSIEHEDTGWDHYADAWRVVTEDGELLGERTLLHPHEGEQPFTRDLDGVKIPAKVKVVYIEAHDSVHGWSTQRARLIIRK